MKVAVTGASGLIGSALVPALRDAGHDVVTLVRRAPAAEHEIAWDPAAGTIDAERLAGIDAVVHLAGETIGQRWSSGARERIRGSRVDGTGLIARTLAALAAAACRARPGFGRRLLRARRRARHGGEPEGCGVRRRRRRGVGSGGRARRERRASASSRCARRRSSTGTRVPSGGCACRSGSGSAAGSAAGTSGGAGPRSRTSVRVLPSRARDRSLLVQANVVGGSVTNREFTRALGRALHRPTVFPLPATAVRLAFGQMGEELLLGGQRPVAEQLERAGFAFHDTDLDRAMAAALAS